MSSLPEDVLVEILVRLPRRSVLSCRAVSSAWRAAASSQCFDLVYAAAQQAGGHRGPAVLVKITTAYSNSDKSSRIICFDYSAPCRRRDDTRGLKKNKQPIPPPVALALDTPEAPDSAVVLGSWDGVFCVPNGGEHVLWNPLTGAYATVTCPSGSGRIIGGYAHPGTRRFHLVHCSHQNTLNRFVPVINPATFRILQVGDANNNWREVPLPGRRDDGAATRFYMRNWDNGPVSLHGSLHWLVGDSVEVMLLAYDIAREEFRFVPAPERRRGALNFITARILVSDDKLCVLDVAFLETTSKLEIWVLDDYSNPRSWRHRETIHMPLCDWVRELASMMARLSTKVQMVDDEDEEEVVLLVGGKIYRNNFRDRSWSLDDDDSYSCSMSLVLHRESLLLPSTSFGEAARVPRRWRDATTGRRCHSLQ